MAPPSKPISKNSRPHRCLKSGLKRATPDTDFWIYDAFVTLDVDEDADGYYSEFTVEFDADTVFVEADVYARLYLSDNDVFEEFHTTSVFIIEGDSSQDALVVESELISGYPSDDYELLIELYDAQTDALVAVFDGFNDADLTFISLESKTFEDSGTVVIVTESGGALDISDVVGITRGDQETDQREMTSDFWETQVSLFLSARLTGILGLDHFGHDFFHQFNPTLFE